MFSIVRDCGDEEFFDELFCTLWVINVMGEIVEVMWDDDGDPYLVNVLLVMVISTSDMDYVYVLVMGILSYMVIIIEEYIDGFDMWFNVSMDF